MSREAFLRTAAVMRRYVSDSFTHGMQAADKEVCGEHVQRLFDHVVMGGKNERALLTIDAHNALRPNASAKEKESVVKLGWSLELLQSSFLLSDDIADEGKTRRGKPCWHTLPDVGLRAVNDALVLESASDSLVVNEFVEHPAYERLVQAMHQTKQRTITGQMLDQATSGTDDCTLDRYRCIAHWKTAHYTYFAPVQYALLVADNWHVFKQTKELCYKLGYFFQAQDDYLDCFGDSKLTGKMGTDLQEGKCSWVSATALHLLNDDKTNLHTFKNLFGRTDADSVRALKAVLNDLNICQKYAEFENEQFDSLTQDISHFPLQALQPVFTAKLDSLFRRKK